MSRWPLSLLLGVALPALAAQLAPPETLSPEALRDSRIVSIFTEAAPPEPALGLLAAANVRSLPVSRLRPGAPAYASADAAAIAGLRDSKRASTSYEYGGAILSNGTRFFATVPVTNNDPGRVRYVVSVPRGFRVAGVYHTHPLRSSEGQWFSPGDVAQARALRASSYLGAMDERTVRHFDPRTMRTERVRHGGSSIVVARGRVIARGY